MHLGGQVLSGRMLWAVEQAVQQQAPRCRDPSPPSTKATDHLFEVRVLSLHGGRRANLHHVASPSPRRPEPLGRAHPTGA